MFSIRNNSAAGVYLNTQNSIPLLLGVSTGTTAGTTVANVAITSAGNVGIGTTAPTAPLHVAGGGLLGTNSTNPLAFTGSGSTLAGIGSYNADTDMNVYAAGAGNIKFTIGVAWSSAGALTNAGTERMRITDTGDVGIGTTTPGSKLDVNGELRIGNTVNTVSPTSPNRTITMVIGGTTYYIHAKTTND
jgi:hypothetical protein